MKRQNKEDYLRAMHSIWNRENKIITSVDIADYLNISKPAVSKMLRKMQEDGLVKIELYSKVKFSAKGLKEARKITSKHRIIEVFLARILRVNPKQIHQEAHILEHSFSDEVLKKLNKFLKNPKFCPHGKKILKL